MRMLGRAVFAAASILVAAGDGTVASAQASSVPLAAQNGQPSLPYAEQKFRGSVGTTYLDSDPATFPAPIKAPAGAPNVLLVLLDDVGFGEFAVTGAVLDPRPETEAVEHQCCMRMGIDRHRRPPAFMRLRKGRTNQSPASS